MNEKATSSSLSMEDGSVPHPSSTSTPTPAEPERPATFRDVLAVRDYRAVFGASMLSWFGDYLARVAVTALVYERTNSVAMAAAALAISFAPWLLIGPILAAVAERFPYRSVMIVSDLARMFLIAAVALPWLPVWAMIVLIFLTALGNPPYDAARSALMASILPGDKLVVGLSLQASAVQAAQLAGYMGGGILTGINPRAALLVDAATFAVSALLMTFFVQRQPPVIQPERRNLLSETRDGFRVVFGTPALRGIVLVVFASMLFPALPEGLAAAWAFNLAGDDDARRGFAQGLIMMSPAVGAVLSGVIIGRLTTPDTRRRLIRPFALLAPLSLVPAIFQPPLWIVCVMAAVCGFCIIGMLPAANGLFVQALPSAYRARAFGVVQSGMQLAQGGSVLAAGALATNANLTLVLGMWCIGGFIVVLVALTTWPSREGFASAIEHARRINEAPATG